MTAEAFEELRSFFTNPVELRRALGWSAPTFRQWTGEAPPNRPRSRTATRVFDLLRVARAAGAWVSDPKSVGEWLLEPHPALNQLPPALFVAGLGSDGAEALVRKMVMIAPRDRAAGSFTDISTEILRATLADLGAPSIRRVEPVAPDDVDFSDFD